MTSASQYAYWESVVKKNAPEVCDRDNLSISMQLMLELTCNNTTYGELSSRYKAIKNARARDSLASATSQPEGLPANNVRECQRLISHVAETLFKIQDRNPELSRVVNDIRDSLLGKISNARTHHFRQDGALTSDQCLELYNLPTVKPVADVIMAMHLGAMVHQPDRYEKRRGANRLAHDIEEDKGVAVNPQSGNVGGLFKATMSYDPNQGNFDHFLYRVTMNARRDRVKREKRHHPPATYVFSDIFDLNGRYQPASPSLQYLKAPLRRPAHSPADTGAVQQRWEDFMQVMRDAIDELGKTKQGELKKNDSTKIILESFLSVLERYYSPLTSDNALPPINIAMPNERQGGAEKRFDFYDALLQVPAIKNMLDINHSIASMPGHEPMIGPDIPVAKRNLLAMRVNKAIKSLASKSPRLMTELQELGLLRNTDMHIRNM